MYDEWKGPKHVGAPIEKMAARVKAWLKRGVQVKILTARASRNNPFRDVSIEAIQKWCKQHLGEVLEVTAEKDFAMIECWDDRAVQVIKNTGERVDGGS
jgi:hypothetical protein